MKKQVKFAIGVSFAILCLLILLVQSNRKVEISTETVMLGTLTDSFREDGLVDSPEDYAIYVPYDAKIKTILTKGTAVKKGDVLFEMDDSNLLLQKQQLESQIASLQGQRSMNAPNITQYQLDMAKIAIDSAKTTLDDAEKNLARTKELYQLDGASLVELEQAQSTYDNASQNFELKKKQLAELQEQKNERAGTGDFYNAQITSLKAQLADTEEKLSNTIVTSPIDGTVKTVNAKAGGYAQAVQSVVEIAAEKNLIVVSEVLTEYAPALKVGQVVNIIQKTYSGDVIHEAKIIHIDDFAKASISSLGLDEQRVTVKAELLKNDGLRDGYDVDAVFLIFEKENTLFISKTSYFEEDGKYFVWKIKGSKIRKTQVELGYLGDYQVEVLGGLEENDRIATDPNHSKLVDGLRVRYEK